MFNKNLLDSYNAEQESIKNALYVLMKNGGYSVAQFAKILGVTNQGLASIFRGAKMTHKIELRLKTWLEINGWRNMKDPENFTDL